MKRKFHFKSISYIVVFLSFIVKVSAQDQKEVLENCETNADCKSGYCVTLRSGEKKCSNCDQSALEGFSSKVDEYCKDLDKGILGYSDLEREFGSKNDVSLILLNYRLESCKKCYDARSERENKCWNGGDGGHKVQLEELKKSMNYLEGIINEKTRYKLAYNCEVDKFEDLEEDIQDNCEGLDDLFAKYGLNDNKEGPCSEIKNLIDKCIDCREAWEDMMSNCFRNGASDARVKRLNEVQDMEKIAKETLEAKEENKLCK